MFALAVNVLVQVGILGFRDMGEVIEFVLAMLALVLAYWVLKNMFG
ncbi:hypothetical protein [Stratiformator vulcanicus]|uniref:Uncharacterized protein n=1 Tax=Stratiformator vulcanicus TaxID=2527980 RepID=A0A517QWD9_9PLAN|nr:hypothetical protein [Stratiformator vulcanicus]QDT35976.1 hypothetical protein Pan189_03310 [Stratiformator vulcanicus]QDT36884.1 hypothetical protein Pan189_12480 [Stratiformator vulcanicus]